MQCYSSVVETSNCSLVTQVSHSWHSWESHDFLQAVVQDDYEWTGPDLTSFQPLSGGRFVIEMDKLMAVSDWRQMVINSKGGKRPY